MSGVAKGTETVEDRLFEPNHGCNGWIDMQWVIVPEVEEKCEKTMSLADLVYSFEWFLVHFFFFTQTVETKSLGPPRSEPQLLHPATCPWAVRSVQVWVLCLLPIHRLLE